MKSLIRSIFKSRKKIFKRIRFLLRLRMLFLKKLLLVKRNNCKIRLQVAQPKSLIRKKSSYNLLIKRKELLQNYLISHASVAQTSIPFIMKFIELKGCLFADKLLIEQLIMLALKKLRYQTNIPKNSSSFLWQNFISNQRAGIKENFYSKG